VRAHHPAATASELAPSSILLKRKQWKWDDDDDHHQTDFKAHLESEE
jgi:hypothetical protein